ncbi:NADPH-cytochrome P450 reductase [Thecamonas trahens ATCC 50062]|uniref:NADPH--hemoprotein reductase n=1 Tax=Thecamonas trahens ATCC 50062 TaxID=461836 RepID=A0A0L0DRP5_THETB|nr:NADPH-cytochrome P450 reductase [Thecamonas trahens ATCC 50062]KNC55004.1 NADPH-cytochrome P450 reductase [Thecamonas trahens ATCC 50062]|eukprot:XP_013753447.1 NADPH-cytochrome P450 reductase [Thecamonas trahens ATCC 50062]
MSGRVVGMFCMPAPCGLDALSVAPWTVVDSVDVEPRGPTGPRFGAVFAVAGPGEADVAGPGASAADVAGADEAGAILPAAACPLSRQGNKMMETTMEDGVLVVGPPRAESSEESCLHAAAVNAGCPRSDDDDEHVRLDLAGTRATVSGRHIRRGVGLKIEGDLPFVQGATGMSASIAHLVVPDDESRQAWIAALNAAAAVAATRSSAPTRLRIVLTFTGPPPERHELEPVMVVDAPGAARQGVELAWQWVAANYLATARAVGLTLSPAEVRRIALVFFGNLALASQHPDFALHVLASPTPAPADDERPGPAPSLAAALASIKPSAPPALAPSPPAEALDASQYLFQAISLVDTLTSASPSPSPVPSADDGDDGEAGSSSGEAGTSGLAILNTSFVARGIFLVSSFVARLVSGPSLKLGVLQMMARATREAGISLQPMQSREPRGPKTRWLVGNIPDILPAKGAVHAAALLTYEYGKLTKLALGKEKLYVVADANYVHRIMASAEKRFPKQEVMARSLFMADGETWASSRRTLLPAFGTRSMKHFVPAFHEATLCLAASMRALAVESPGTAFNCFDAFKELTFQVICRCGFDYDASRANPHAEAFTSAFEFIIHHQVTRSFQFGFLKILPTSSNRRFAAAKASIETVVADIMAQRLAERPAGVARGELPPSASEHADFLAFMMDNADPETGDFISHDIMQEQVMVFLAAGHVTTTLLTSWALFCIAQHPEVEAKILAELAGVLGPDPAALPSFAQIGEMHYLLMVLKETLRLYPAAQSVIRYHPEPFVVGGYRVAGGSHSMTVPWVIHRDPELWSQPEAFIPERFAPERETRRHPFAWMPFGGGDRVCIGSRFALLEVRAVVAVLLRNFHFEVPPGFEVAASRNPVEPDGGLLLVPSLRDSAAAASQGAALYDSLASFATHDPDALADHIPKHLEVVANVCGMSGEQLAAAAAAAQESVAAAAASPELSDEVIRLAPSLNGVEGGLELVIGYGSNMGTSRGFAQTIEADARRRYGSALSRVVISPLDEVLSSGALVSSEPDATSVLVVVTSSYNGEPPDNARDFVAWLSEASPESAGLGSWYTAVFGCGNTQWGHRFQAVPKKVAHELERLGVSAICERGAGDDDTSLDMDFEAWYTLFVPALDMAYGVEAVPLVSADGADDIESGDELPALVLEAAGPHAEALSLEALHSSDGGRRMRVVVNDELLSPEYVRKTGFSTRHIEVMMNSGENDKYAPGDHIGVFPANPEAAVVRFAVLAGLYDELDELVVVGDGGSSWDVLQPGTATTARFVLTHVVDVCGAPPRMLLRKLAQFCSVASERATLEMLGSSTAEGMAAYDELVLGRRLTVSDVLRQFPSVAVAGASVWFCGLLPKLKPRLYSISSAPQGGLNEVVSLTVGVVRETAPAFGGLASNYLAELAPGTELWAFTRSCDPHFRVPAAGEGGSTDGVAMALVGPGTGFAPFRGFLHEVARRPGPHTQHMVFIGCRQAGGDELYADELDGFEAAGVVGTVSRAYSREQTTVSGSRMYVQDRMAEAARPLWEKILSPVAGGRVFVCGDGRRMAKDVRRVVARIAEDEGGVTDGVAWLADMQASGRYVEDVWG